MLEAIVVIACCLGKETWKAPRGDQKEDLMTQEAAVATKDWRGRFFEDFEVGDVFRSRLGRTMTEVDNISFTALTMNTNQIHFNTPFAERTRFGKPLMNSCLTLGVVCGLSVPDTSENGTANLAWTDIKLPNPVFAGD